MVLLAYCTLISQPYGQTASAVGDVTNLPLPEGWEMALTAQGVPYFIDHKRKTTCWTG